jgi:NTE family protein
MALRPLNGFAVLRVNSSNLDHDGGSEPGNSKTVILLEVLSGSRMYKRVFTGLIAAWVLLAGMVQVPVVAQDARVRSRPTVGLVLSGGGARGFAHVGVLKVLEENRVPVDYIGGASIGGLIGALYAMGKTPAEIEQLIETLDWDKLFVSSTSFDKLSFRRKEDRRNIPGPIPLRGSPKDLRLPTAFNSGHEIGLLFDRVTLPYARVNNFDDLPIPFRTVGTNMVNGLSEELKGGSLSRSLRATMSIPGVFAPVEIDGKILSDGGLVNNIPTNVVKAMGADILIVVNIETQLSDRASLESLIGVLAQTINIATADNSRRSLQQADLIIAPDLAKFTTASFGSSDEIIKLGYDGAKQKELLLRGLSLGEAEWQAHLAARTAREKPDTDPVLTFLAIEGSDRDAERTIREKLGSKYIGLPIDERARNELERDLSELTGTGRFDALNYKLTEKDGKLGLSILTNETNGKPNDPTRLDIGFDVNSIETDDASISLLARLTFFDVGRSGAEWRNDLRLGSNALVASEYFRPIGTSKVFIAPRLSYERRKVSFYEDTERVAEYSFWGAQAGVDIGYTFNPRSEMRAGYSVGYEKASLRIGDPLLPESKGKFSLASLRWSYDGLDQAQVPRKGILSRNSIGYYFDTAGRQDGITQAETRTTAFVPISERNTLFTFGGAGTSFGSSAPVLRQYTLGGPFRLGGYGVDEFRGSNYAFGGIGILHSRQILPALFGGKAYVGAWYEGGSAYERLRDASYRQSVSTGLIVETPLGPILFGGGVNENGKGRFFFSFGRFLR